MEDGRWNRKYNGITGENAILNIIRYRKKIVKPPILIDHSRSGTRSSFVFFPPDANHLPSCRGHSTSADGLAAVAVTDVKERVLVPNKVEQVAGEEGALNGEGYDDKGIIIPRGTC